MTELSVAERYLAVWNEPDADARRVTIENLWTSDGVYTDPLATVRGHEGVGAVITQAREMLVGHRIGLLENVDTHHDVVRFGWEAVPEAGGEATVVGFDVAVTDDEGRLRAVYGFLDKVPA